MCILPINIVNEKVYIFLWFWFYFLALVSAVALIYRASTIFYPGLRRIAVHSHCRIADPKLIKEVLQMGGVGDWFILDLLSKNIDPLNFNDLMTDLKLKNDGYKNSKNGL